MTSGFHWRSGRGIALVLATVIGAGCGGLVPLRGLSWLYFEPPPEDDPWSAKITSWQARERAQPALEVGQVSPAAVAEPGAERAEGAPATSLQAKFAAFRAEQKRSLARDAARWIQQQAKQHYVPDGPLDHWATLHETLQRNGDDCDGLELLVFHLLRDLGFEEEEVYRAIVHRPADGQHHMVTLWFEDPDDPWVIDPTGAMTSGMPRMSEVPGWVPLKVFSDTEEFTVRTSHASLRTE